MKYQMKNNNTNSKYKEENIRRIFRKGRRTNSNQIENSISDETYGFTKCKKK